MVSLDPRSAHNSSSIRIHMCCWMEDHENCLLESLTQSVGGDATASAPAAPSVVQVVVWRHYPVQFNFLVC